MQDSLWCYDCHDTCKILLWLVTISTLIQFGSDLLTCLKQCFSLIMIMKVISFQLYFITRMLFIFRDRKIIKNSTHLPLDKMSAILQMIVSDAFSWMKSFVFWLKFHLSLFLRVQLTITQAIIWPILTWFADTYAALGGDELRNGLVLIRQLTHRGLVTQYDVRDLGEHWLR